MMGKQFMVNIGMQKISKYGQLSQNYIYEREFI